MPTPQVQLRSFVGSPLALLQEIAGCRRLILMDAVSTGRRIGSVLLFSEQDLVRFGGGGARGAAPHGINLAEALLLGRSLAVPLPSWIRLIGIEAGPIREFSADLSPELAAELDRIVEQAYALVDGLLEESRQEEGDRSIPRSWILT